MHERGCRGFGPYRGEAGDLVAQALRGDDGHLLSHALVGGEVQCQTRVVLLDDLARGLLHRLGTNATLKTAATPGFLSSVAWLSRSARSNVAHIECVRNAAISRTMRQTQSATLSCPPSAAISPGPTSYPKRAVQRSLRAALSCGECARNHACVVYKGGPGAYHGDGELPKGSAKRSLQV
jgi:hypothetical protein